MKNSQETKISKKYAQALFESLSADETDGMKAALDELSQAWQANLIFQDAVKNPLTPSSAIIEISKTLAEKIRPGYSTFSNFVEQAATHGRFEYLPLIATAFTELGEKSRGVVKVVVSSAFELSDDEKLLWQKRLSEQHNSTVQIEWQTDPSLIGGIVLKIGDKVLDNSLRNSLRKLEVDLL